MLMMGRGDQFNGRSLIVGAEAVAILLGISVRTVNTWAEEGRLPRPVDAPGPRRWTRQSIEDWITRGCPPQRRSLKRK